MAVVGHTVYGPDCNLGDLKQTLCAVVDVLGRMRYGMFDTYRGECGKGSSLSAHNNMRTKT